MDQDKKIDYKRKQNIKYKIWNYIRRNRTFRVGELFLVFNVSYSSIRAYLKALEEIEYIKFCGKNRKPYSEVQYTLIKNTGIFPPKLNGNTIYDPNNKEKFITSRKVKEKIVFPKKLMSILIAIDEEQMTFEELKIKANCQTSGLRKWWNRLIEFGVIEGPIKLDKKTKWDKGFLRKDGALVFKFNLEKSKIIIQELLNGAYTKSNPEMKHLWTH